LQLLSSSKTAFQQAHEAIGTNFLPALPKEEAIERVRERDLKILETERGREKWEKGIFNGDKEIVYR